MYPIIVAYMLHHGTNPATAVFLGVFEKIKALILDEMPTTYEMPKAAVDWVAEMLPYTVKGGKMNRGLTVLHTAVILAGDKELTSLQQEEACVVGWCIEWLQAFFLVEDDIMDDSKMRRGQPCWFRRKEVCCSENTQQFMKTADLGCVVV